MDPPPLPRRCRPSNAPRIHAPGAIWPILAVLAVVALLSLPTLTGSALETAGGTVGPTAAAAADSGCPPVNLPTPICHVFVIFMENQNESWVMRHAPFQEYLAKTYAFAPDYYSVIHYSYPNYVAATSGTETNYLNLHNEKNVVDLIKKAPGNLTWMAYFEDMPHPCDNTTAAGYRVAHNPFVFYTDIRDNQCVLPGPRRELHQLLRQREGRNSSELRVLRTELHPLVLETGVGRAALRCVAPHVRLADDQLDRVQPHRDLHHLRRGPRDGLSPGSTAAPEAATCIRSP